MSYSIGSKVNVHGFGHAVIGDVSRKGNQFRCDFPSGTWGWHYEHELSEAPEFDPNAAKREFGESVRKMNWEHRKALLGFYGE